MPSIGVRYWVSEKIGLDSGLGLGVATQEDFNDCVVEGGVCTEARVGGVDGGFGSGLHFGLPVALKTYEHFNILLTPEIYFRFSPVYYIQ